MKKAKFMLSALALVAVVGGALAFKSFNNHKLYTIKDANGNCTVAITQRTFDPLGTNLISITDVANGPCVLSASKVIAD